MDSMCPRDSCDNIKEALSVLGDKWSALLLRLLHDKPYRFCQLEDQLEGISTRTLTNKLDMLLDKQIIQKTKSKECSAHFYELTVKGSALDEVIHAMAA